MAPTTRAGKARAAASCAGLPADVLFDVLLRFSAKELCRLHTVCRSWRSLTSDPVFVRAHADRHREPRFLAKFRDDRAHVYVVDLSGNVVRRIAGADSGHQVVSARSNLACLATGWNTCRVLNPATGAVHVLPQSPAAEHVNRVNLRDPCTFFALGWVASTTGGREGEGEGEGEGEYKVLRTFNRPGFACLGEQLFEVLTLNNDGGGDQARWRGREGHGMFTKECPGVVVDCVVYFLTRQHRAPDSRIIPPDYVLSFDLRREEWRTPLQGPISPSITSKKALCQLWSQLTLADLKGSLVLAHHCSNPFIMDLWFLVDFGNGLWVKKYNIQTESVISRLALDKCHLRPLMLLDDGRLVTYLAPTGQLFLCDPGTNNFAPVDMRRLDSVAVYTGSLLSVREGDMV